MNRQSYCIANWKMNHTKDSMAKFVTQIKREIEINTKVRPIICPAYIHLNELKELLGGLDIGIGSQNASEYESGAYTGEISINMLKEFGIEYVIIGHSERRHIFSESDGQINSKLNAVIKGGLTPILCIGETIEDRKNGKTNQVLQTQLSSAFSNINDLSGVSILAYEPVWAIGSGIAADADTIEETHQSIRTLIENVGAQSQSLALLYGGSVTPENCSEIFQLENVDGFLIGGASLKAETFLDIYHQMV